MRAVERPVAFVLGTGVGWAAIALLATWGSSRGGSMLGRSRGTLALLVVVTPVALEAWYLGWIWRSDVAITGSPALTILPCVLATLAMALAPFTVFFLGRRGTDPTHPRAMGSAFGVVCGAWGALLIDLHCERADVMHVTLGHVLPALFLAGLGFALGARLLGIRAERLGHLSRGPS